MEKNNNLKNNDNTITNNLKNTQDVFLNKDIINNPMLSFNGFCAYVGLKKLQLGKSSHFVSVEHLYFALTSNISLDLNQGLNTHTLTGITRPQRNFLKKGILDLLNLNIISALSSDIHNNAFVLDLSNIFIESNSTNFCTLPYEDLFKIMNLKPSLTATSKILKYYCTIISHYMGKDRFAALFAKDLQQEINVDIVTVRTYNKLLQDAKILYIHKNNTFYNTQTQEMEHLPSTYGSYKFKQEIEEFNKAMIDKITFNKSKFKQTRLTKGNENRSVCLKYRHFCEDNDKYSPTEVFELYEQIIARNNNVINSPKNKNSSLIKSLEPFDNYFKPYNIIAEIKNIDLKSVVSTLSKKEIKINDLNSVGELFGLEVIPDLIDYFKFANVTFNLVKSPLMTKLPKTKTKLNSENHTNDSQDSQENNLTEQKSQITPIFNFPKTHAKN